MRKPTVLLAILAVLSFVPACVPNAGNAGADNAGEKTTPGWRSTDWRWPCSSKSWWLPTRRR